MVMLLIEHKYSKEMIKKTLSSITEQLYNNSHALFTMLSYAPNLCMQLNLLTVSFGFYRPLE